MSETDKSTKESSTESKKAMNGATDNDNFLPLPLYAPLPQEVAVMPDGTTTREAARKITERNKHKEDWDETFAIGDIGVLLKQYKRWKRELPRVEVFYAVKANALRPVISTMAALGCGFDCASRNELELVSSCGVGTERIIYAHPCKLTSHLSHARFKGVEMMTFDNEEEMIKVKKYFPDARLVLRIKTDDTTARTKFGKKFGATVEYSKHLIRRAKELEMNVIGISFHVGSSCPSVKTFAEAIEDSRCLFDFARALGFDFNLLDIGGGFPGTEEAESVVSFETMALTIRTALEKYFPDENEVRIIAEPGRFFPGPTFALATNVSSKKVTQDQVFYHIGDCIYNSFYLVLVEKVKLVPVPLHATKEERRKSTVYGISCSGLDTITRDVEVQEVNVGDWMLWSDAGGYAALTRFGFNGYSMYKACYFITESEWEELQRSSLYPSLLPKTRSAI